METIHFISIGYILLSCVLMMMRKYRLKFLAMIPPVTQVASVLVLNAMGFPAILMAVLVIVNLFILVVFDAFEKKQMAEDFPVAQPAEQPSGYEEPAYTASQNSFAVDTHLFTGSFDADPHDVGAVTGELPVIPEVGESELKFPEVENRPINETVPVEQEIFNVSNNEVKEMIDAMLESGDMANAKRYLRMLAFFAKEEATRELAEKRLAEINKME